MFDILNDLAASNNFTKYSTHILEIIVLALQDQVDLSNEFKLRLSTFFRIFFNKSHQKNWQKSLRMK